MASRIKGRARERSKGAISRRDVILGVTAALVPASCATPPGESPPIDFDATPDGKSGDATTTDARQDVSLIPSDATAGGDGSGGEPDSTLVDLDGEADAGHFPGDAAGDHDAARPRDGSFDGETS